MDKSNVAVNKTKPDSWECKSDQHELEHLKEELLQSQKELEQDRRKLELEKREFECLQEIMEKKQAQEKRLFEMKWKVMEEELRNMAEERRNLEQKKDFYYQRLKEQDNIENHKNDGYAWKPNAWGGIFFKGVGNELALKKRYKDLLKIFHPDNLSGDTHTLQEINREYNQLKNAFSR